VKYVEILICGNCVLDFYVGAFCFLNAYQIPKLNSDLN